MDYLQFFTLFLTIIGGFTFMRNDLKTFEKEIREDIKTQAARSDQLYTMFIDLLKSKKDA